MKRILLLLLVFAVASGPCPRQYKPSLRADLSLLSPSMSGFDVVVSVEQEVLTKSQQDDRRMFIVDHQGGTDTMLRMRTAGREYIHRDLESTIESGHAVNFDLVRARKAIASVGLDAYLDSLFSGSVEEISARFSRRLSVSKGNNNARRNLEKILSDDAERISLRGSVRKILLSIEDSSESLNSRNIIILLDGENDFFSMGFVLMHAGHYRGRDSIYVHRNFVHAASSSVVQSVFEYGDRCLNASVALEDIPEFRAVIKDWWVKWVRSNLKLSIMEMQEAERKNGTFVSREMNKRINTATRLSALFGIWNEFRAAEILSLKDRGIRNMGQSLVDEKGITIGEYDALIIRPDGKYGLVETKSWNFTSPNPAAIKRALIGHLENSQYSERRHYVGGKLGRFLSFHERFEAGEKFSGVPDDFRFGELVIMVDNEAVESVLYQLALNDPDVRGKLEQYRKAGIEVKCGFMPKNTALWPTVPITDLTRLLERRTAAGGNNQEVLIYSDRGIPLFGRAVDYYNACVRVARRNRGHIDMRQYLKNSDGYEELLAKLVNIDSIIKTKGLSVVDANIHIPGTLVWVDAIVQMRPDVMKHMQKAIKMNNQRGSKRFIALGNKMDKLVWYWGDCIARGEEVDKTHVERLLKGMFVQINKHRKGLKGKSKAQKAKNLEIRQQLNKIRKHIEAALDSLESNIEALHISRVFVHPHSSESEIAEGKRRVEKQLRNMVEVFSLPAVREELGNINRVRLIFDARGHKEIRDFISAKREEIEESTNGFVKISFSLDLPRSPDAEVNFVRVRNRLVPLLRKYAFTSIIRLFDVVYSRFVGLLFEMQGVEFLKYSMGYDILAHGIELYDPETDIYVTELDAVLRDQSISGSAQKPAYKICEIRSCRTPLQFEKFLQERFYYKPETYERKRIVINNTIKDLSGDENAEFSEVIFMLDVGHNFEFIDHLIELEEKFSQKYGFPVKFVFLESSPYGISVASRHNLEMVDLLPVDDHFMAEEGVDLLREAS